MSEDRSKRGKLYWQDLQKIVNTAVSWHQKTGKNAIAATFTRHDWNRLHVNDDIKTCWKLLVKGPRSNAFRTLELQNLTYGMLLSAAEIAVQKGSYHVEIKGHELDRRRGLIKLPPKQLKPNPAPEEPPARKRKPATPKVTVEPATPQDAPQGQQSGGDPDNLKITIWYIDKVGGPEKAKNLVEKISSVW